MTVDTNGMMSERVQVVVNSILLASLFYECLAVPLIFHVIQSELSIISFVDPVFFSLVSSIAKHRLKTLHVLLFLSLFHFFLCLKLRR